MQSSSFLNRYGKTLGYSLLIGVALLLFWSRPSFKKERVKGRDFFTMHQITEACRRGEPLSEELLLSAERILSKHEELHPSYDGLIALSLLSQERKERGHAYLLAQLARATGQGLSPAYCRFTEGTLRALEGDFESAALLARELEEELAKGAPATRLRAYNLMRLAVLAKKLHQTDLCKASVATLETLPAFTMLASLLQKGEASLINYLTQI